ncbi:MAG: hypothetical protein EOO41_00005 [Methanobacteriota archaeon]|nr:MAG: hypothetical protein EOO41_00005 [Euryarchaeota archaeon]
MQEAEAQAALPLHQRHGASVAHTEASDAAAAAHATMDVDSSNASAAESAPVTSARKLKLRRSSGAAAATATAADEPLTDNFAASGADLAAAQYAGSGMRPAGVGAGTEHGAPEGDTADAAAAAGENTSYKPPTQGAYVDPAEAAIRAALLFVGDAAGGARSGNKRLRLRPSEREEHTRKSASAKKRSKRTEELAEADTSSDDDASSVVSSDAGSESSYSDAEVPRKKTTTKKKKLQPHATGKSQRDEVREPRADRSTKNSSKPSRRVGAASAVEEAAEHQEDAHTHSAREQKQRKLSKAAEASLPTPSDAVSDVAPPAQSALVAATEAKRELPSSAPDAGGKAPAVPSATSEARAHLPLVASAGAKTALEQLSAALQAQDVDAIRRTLTTFAEVCDVRHRMRCVCVCVHSAHAHTDTSEYAAALVRLLVQFRVDVELLKAIPLIKRLTQVKTFASTLEPSVGAPLQVLVEATLATWKEDCAAAVRQSKAVAKASSASTPAPPIASLAVHKIVPTAGNVEAAFQAANAALRALSASKPAVAGAGAAAPTTGLSSLTRVAAPTRPPAPTTLSSLLANAALPSVSSGTTGVGSAKGGVAAAGSSDAAAAAAEWAEWLTAVPRRPLRASGLSLLQHALDTSLLAAAPASGSSSTSSSGSGSSSSAGPIADITRVSSKRLTTYCARALEAALAMGSGAVAGSSSKSAISMSPEYDARIRRFVLLLAPPEVSGINVPAAASTTIGGGASSAGASRSATSLLWTTVKESAEMEEAVHTCRRLVKCISDQLHDARQGALSANAAGADVCALPDTPSLTTILPYERTILRAIRPILDDVKAVLRRQTIVVV